MNGTAAEQHEPDSDDDDDCPLFPNDLVVRLDHQRRYADIGVVEDELKQSEDTLPNPAVCWLCSGTYGELDPLHVASTFAGIDRGDSSKDGAPAVAVFDRDFSAGKAVQWANDEAGQAGIIEAIRFQCHLYVPGYNRLLTGVSADRILCGNFMDTIGRQSVQCDGWFGTLKWVARELVQLKFTDGSIICLPSHLLENDDTNIIGDSLASASHPFACKRLYRGAFIELCPGLLHSHRSDIEWLRLGSNPGALQRCTRRRRLTAQVVSIEPASFEVDWHACFPNFGSPMDELPAELEAERLLACNPALGADKPAVVDRMNLGSFAYVTLRQDDVVLQVEPRTSLGCALYELLLGDAGAAADLACKILPADLAGAGVEVAPGDEREATAAAAARVLDAGGDNADNESGVGGRSRASIGRKRRVSQRASLDSQTEGDAVLRELQRRPLQAGQLLAVRLVGCSTRVDVRWQDGRLQTDIAACELVPFDDIEEGEFIPGQFVIISQQQQQQETISDASNGLATPDRYALVLENDIRQKLATVQWFRDTAAAAAEPLGPPELVSTIDLKLYAMYMFRPRTIVTMKPQLESEEEEEDEEEEEEAAATEAQPSSDAAMETGEVENEPSPGLIPLGNVVRIVLETGKIRVAWFDGEETDLWPNELLSLECLLHGCLWRKKPDFINDDMNEDEDDRESSEMDFDATAGPDEKVDTDQVENEVQVTSGGDMVAIATSGDTAAADSDCQLPHHASCSNECDCTGQRTQADRQVSPASATVAACSTAPTAAESAASESTADGGAGTFLLVECAPQTHLHYTESAFSSSGLPPKAFVSAWRREVALLVDHLPRGVTVKAYEDRMDLLAVLIEGPAGTPYSGALFLFDLHLPTTYPAQPPHLLYRSMCSGQLNPNLYECGKVCVSLLGTWDGQGTERWAPGESNLLQVCVSVQSLILVEEPVFNEPGHERGARVAAVKSREYNELAVVRTAQSMANLVSSPPDTFSAEVGRYAGTRLRSYVDQLTDWLTERGCPGFPLLPLSAGAKLSLTAVVKRLTDISDRLQRL